MCSTCQKDNWYAFYTRSRSEKQVLLRLQEAGFNVYLPLITRVKQWSDRKKKVQEPLIRSYVFVRIVESKIPEILKDSGVIFVLKFLGHPAIVKENEIRNLKILTAGESDRVSLIPIEKMIEGTRVKVVKGAFSGLEGEYLRMKGKFRVIVKMETLGTVISVDIPGNFIEKM